MKNIFVISSCLLFLLIGKTSFAQLKKVTILGSSTAYGTGASTVDSSWVGRLRASFNKNNSDGIDTVINNRAVGGYVTYKSLPTGWPHAVDRPDPDPNANVNYVLNDIPRADIVIISYPTNDIVNGYTPKEMMDNLRVIYQELTAGGFTCFITTSQPRNTASDAQRLVLRQLVDSIQINFGNYAINFWDDIATTDGQYLIKPELNSGDGTHLNDLGHRLLFEKVLAKNIFNATPPNPGVTTRIEAENYTNMSGVAKENTSDAGGGQNVGYIDINDWMDYSVNVSSAGSYAINLRVASPSGGQLQIKNASGIVLATVAIPNTGGWQNWQTVSANVTLQAGTQTIRVQSTSNGWNFNWLEIATGGTTPPPNPGVTTRIEAENYTNMSGVAKENTSDAGGGQNVGYIDINDWMDYSVNVSSAGSYAINLRVASPSGGQLQIKNASGIVLATVAIPNTGGWQNWQTVSANVTLQAGTQTIRVQSTSNGWNFNWLEIATGGTTPPPNPGVTTRIEAENYTNMSGVAKENTSDAGGGQNVGYIDINDWMDYSVNVSSAGSYAINLRVASPSGGQLQIKNASGIVLATVAIPNTGGWQNWQTVSANVTLQAGTQTIRVQSTSNGWNFNWLEIATGGTTPPPNPGVTTRIEAENYTNMSGVAKENTSDAGGGQNVGYIDINDWMDYSVNVSSAGSYAINLRVASPSGGQLQIKNASGIVLATVAIPNTGGWQNWQTVSANVTLQAGTQTIRVQSTSNGWNFNWWELSSSASSLTLSAKVSNETNLLLQSTTTALQIYPNPVADRFYLKLNSELKGKVKVSLINISGQTIKQFTLNKVNQDTAQWQLSIEQLPKGKYLLQVSIGKFNQTAKLIKE